MKTVYFVRHGESQANVDGLMAGRFDSPLTEQGEAQAKKAGIELKNKGIELVVCSPLKRTVGTATLIAQQINYNPDQIVLSEYFIERSYGDFEGRPYLEFRKVEADPGAVSGLETTKEMHARVLRGLEWLKSLDAKTILVVSHGGTGRMMRLVDQNLDHGDLHKIERFGNTEIDEFKL